MRRVTTIIYAAVALLLLMTAMPPAIGAQTTAIDFSREPACQSRAPASMGGPAPVSPNLVVVRYLGSSNHEIAYRNTVLLLNAHYARVAPARPLGFTRDEVKKADAILIGHGHGDHMSDAPYVAKRPVPVSSARRLRRSRRRRWDSNRDRLIPSLAAAARC